MPEGATALATVAAPPPGLGERLLGQLAERFGHHPLFARLRGAAATASDNPLLRRGSELVEEMKDRYETSDHPAVHKVEVRQASQHNCQWMAVHNAGYRMQASPSHCLSVPCSECVSMAHYVATDGAGCFPCALNPCLKQTPTTATQPTPSCCATCLLQDVKEKLFGLSEAAAAMTLIRGRDPRFDMGRLLLGVRCARVCVRACMHACMHACVRTWA